MCAEMGLAGAGVVVEGGGLKGGWYSENCHNRTSQNMGIPRHCFLYFKLNCDSIG